MVSVSDSSNCGGASGGRSASDRSGSLLMKFVFKMLPISILETRIRM